MSIEDFLSPECVLADVKASDKARLLADLAGRAADATGLEALSIAEAVLRREQLGSTGMGGGIAVPHARLRGIESAFGLLARLKRPIDFDAIDRQPVDLVFLLLLPADAPGDLNALAAVARTLRDPQRQNLMREAKDASALYRVCVGPS